MKPLLKKYADLKAVERETSLKLKELSDEILAEMNEKGIDKIDGGEIGNFTVGNRKKWFFTGQVAAMEEKLKTLEEEEKATGAATFEETKFLLFKSMKKDV